MGITISLPSIEFNGIEAILFDLDGTLIDSLDLHIESFQWILERLGKDIPKHQLEPLMGKTPQDIIQTFFNDMSQEELLDAASQKEAYLSTLIESVHVYPNIRELLRKLSKNGIKPIVISSTHKKLVRILLKTAGLLSFFADIVSGDEVAQGKPDPEPFRLGLHKAGVTAKQALAIGDSIHDYQSADAAGLVFIGILTGKTGLQKFKSVGVRHIIGNISELSLVDD